VALALSGCRHFLHLGAGIKGSGTLQTEKRNVGNFTGLAAGGAFDIEVVCQKDVSVQLTGDDNLLQHVTTEVRNGVLHVENTRNLNFSKQPRLKISVPDLQDMDLSGACETRVSDVKAKDFKVNLSGASHLRATGQVTALDANISGASNFDAKDLPAVRANVIASGASKAKLNASDTLQADASGASTINYFGTPKNLMPKATGASNVSAGS
jgi:hypothetical protein